MAFTRNAAPLYDQRDRIFLAAASFRGPARRRFRLYPGDNGDGLRGLGGIPGDRPSCSRPSADSSRGNVVLCFGSLRGPEQIHQNRVFEPSRRLAFVLPRPIPFGFFARSVWVDSGKGKKRRTALL